MSTLLDEALVADSLLSLPGWEGDAHLIWRDVTLPATLDAELRRQVAVDADAMNHHPEVEKVDRGTRFTLWTHSDGGVTELDITLAAHISDLIHRIDEGQPGIAAVRPGDAVVTFRSLAAEQEQTGATG
jgi:4a-hydroxytetrahydrobiopterin dehydratase